MPALVDVVAALDSLYPPVTAAEWDAVGPVCGDPGAQVSTVLFAIDPVDVVVAEAIAVGAQLLVTHHPLYLRGTSTVYGGTAKGRLVQRLISARCALFVAHTNADDAPRGVSAALAAALGLVDVAALVPGVGAADGRGSGRIGSTAEPTTLGSFAQAVAAALPATPAGIKVAGDLQRPVTRVAVCGGAGDAHLRDATAAGADVYLTADLRHHYTSEHLTSGGPALIDPGHWASEWPWLPVAAGDLAAALADTVEVRVSYVVTDPWTALVTQEPEEGSAR